MKATSTDPMSHTPEEWQAKANRSQQNSAESFERCDTDGFLSQWASEQMARRYRTLAEIAANDGKALMPFLADADGNVIEGARYVETRYGWSWVYDGPNGAVWFRPSDHSNKEIARQRDLAKGHQEVWLDVPVLMGSDGHLFVK